MFSRSAYPHIVSSALLSSVLAATPLTGCGSAGPAQSEALPSWVLTPPAGLCGVGSAPRSSSKATDRTIATARGRAQLAAQVELQVQSLLRSYEEEGGAGPVTQHISAQQVSQRLIGARPRREHPGRAELFVLVCIGGEQVSEALERVVETHEVSPKVKRQLRARSQEAFQELEAQLEEAFGSGLD